MKNLILVGILLFSFVAFSTPVVHSGVTDKQEFKFDFSDNVAIGATFEVIDFVFANDTVDFNYSSVAIIPMVDYEFIFVFPVGIANLVKHERIRLTEVRSRGSPIIISQ